jgi:hypothetical protein
VEGMKHSLKIPLKVNRARTKLGPRYTKLSAGIAAGKVRFVVFPQWKRAAESNAGRGFAISSKIGPCLTPRDAGQLVTESVRRLWYHFLMSRPREQALDFGGFVVYQALTRF